MDNEKGGFFLEEKNLAHDDNEIKSELMPGCYDDSSLSWYVRYILDNSDEFKNLDSYQLETGLENFFNSFPIEKKGSLLIRNVSLMHTKTSFNKLVKIVIIVLSSAYFSE